MVASAPGDGGSRGRDVGREPPLESAPAIEPTNEPARGTLLIVDDSASMRLSLEILIRAEGLFEQVIAVADATEALRCVREVPVDLVLCDLHLRGMDGLKLAWLLASMEDGVPFVLITGHDTSADASCVAAVLPKPVDAPVLMAALRRHRRAVSAVQPAR